MWLRSVVTLRWTGNTRVGRVGYQEYEREHDVIAPGKLTLIQGTADPALLDALRDEDPEQSRHHRAEALRLLADVTDPRAEALRARIGLIPRRHTDHVYTRLSGHCRA